MTATPGFISAEVRPCIETPDRYLLLVGWETLEAHTVDFRGSDRYQVWREKLHHFYEPLPAVEHYGEPVASAEIPNKIVIPAEAGIQTAGAFIR